MPIALVLVLGLTLESPSGDLAAIQRTVIADLIGGAATRLGSAFCVWVAPPGGDPEGPQAPHASLDLRAPSAAFLASIPATAGITVRGGPACEPKMEGARVRDTREPAWIIEVGRPELDGATATVEGGASCGGECSTRYRFTLESTPAGWRVQAKEILSIS
jgi:hypothetical protein